MKKLILKYKWLTIVLVFVLGVLASAATWQSLVLHKAHSTFNNYYVFRDCTQLLQKETDWATCRTNTGQTIKLVEFHSKWYLSNDLPFCLHNFCL